MSYKSELLGVDLRIFKKTLLGDSRVEPELRITGLEKWLSGKLGTESDPPRTPWEGSGNSF